MSATVSVVDGATCNGMVTSGCAQIPPTVAVGLGPYGVAIDQATEAVVVTNAEYEPTSLDYTVSIIDGARCNARHRAGCGGPPKTVEVGGAPAGVAVDDHTDTAYVVNLGDWTLSVLRP
jgi:DNA-binding beta-propeller fold protein YncE